MKVLEPMLSYRGIDWLYEYNPSKRYIEELLEKYELHELVEEDISEPNTQDKIDVYDQCIFLVLHFPKYNKATSKYHANEFNLIMAKNYVITLTTYQTDHVIKLKEDFLSELGEVEADEKHKFSPYYLVYRIMDIMYDKTNRALTAFTKDLRELENNIFAGIRLDKSLLEKIMVRKRNAVIMKHMFLPHQEIIALLQEEVIKFFWGELDVYFEDLAYKIDKILNTVEILHEDIESLYDTYNAMVNMKTNTIITVLTMFSVVTGILTWIAGIYGMNVPLPGGGDSQMIWRILCSMALLSLGTIWFFRKKKWL